ncbi:BEM_collapsed_G0030030.mRNA.1.CDS.1 [Saccharomyces cerevisiae]|nr:BEM_HP_G0130780.mRNA.1.CDS.1 [Saccharomyces cerevisiae]CAI6482335.1 BEM_HP_G0130780.mRNA.1.CDS.1 [Saccharomyces cerevisiae]CAI7180914.1 BEM_collapsed_G0030030.mRNA.1.CDS.1 [Saccharomyces cerevisiae]
MASQATTLRGYNIRKRDNVFEPKSSENLNSLNQSEEEGHIGRWPPLGYEAVSAEQKSAVQLRESQAGASISNNMNFKANDKSFSTSTAGRMSPDTNSLHHILPKNQVKNNGQTMDANCNNNVSNDANVPVCKNCLTSTTPLWRRDEHGAMLCNACGLFLKLHGKPRPISLKTDVIKSRNRKSNTNHAHNLDNFRNQTLIAELKGDCNIESSGRKANRVTSEDKKKKSSQLLMGTSSTAKISKKPKTESKERSDSHLSATKLEVLMSGDCSRPKLKPKLPKQDTAIYQEKLLTFPSYTDVKEYSNSAHQSAFIKERSQFNAASFPLNASHSVTSKTGADSPQLPHLSMLLGSLSSTSISNNGSEIVSNCNNGIASTAATLAPTSSRTTDSNPSEVPNQIRSTMSSPDIISAKRNDPAPLSFHMASINDMLETRDRAISNVKTETTPPHFIPFLQSSKAPCISKANSQSISNSVSSSDVSGRKFENYPAKDLGDQLSTKLHKEEEIIKLKTRINELELVTDLYRRHINELDGKCRALEERLQRTVKQEGNKGG